MATKKRTTQLTAALQREGKLYVAQCPEVDVASQGRAVEEALANLAEALELYFEDADAVAAPTPIIAPVEVRLPRGIRPAPQVARPRVT